nr:LysM peptidoglycan-binding domain-containing protein [Paenibacillus sp. SYP-B3998]
MQEGLAGIEELNDVELLPHIQVITLDDQAILKGNLLLTGNYISDGSQEPRSLEHLIPVEITLPLNRIHRVEDILVEIENFDIDLLSERSLNVTGVLSLQGVEMVSAPVQSWREEEEITFVHQTDHPRFEPGPPTPPPAPTVSTGPVAGEPESSLTAPAQVVPAPIPTSYQEPATHTSEQSYAAPFTQSPLVQQPEAAIEEPPTTEQNDLIIGQIEDTELKLTDYPESTIVTEEKKELKVAFGKKANEAVDINPHGIKSLLSKAGSFLHDKRKEEAQAALAEETRIDAVEWKRLFLQSSTSSNEFRKLKMCIVQREETLETIAKRYQLNPRELQLLNRLSDQDVSVGQVIYLPK